MCYNCWDADKKDEILKTQGPEACSGEEMVKMSLHEMQQCLTEEWLETEKQHFRVFKEAIPEIALEAYSWEATNPKTHTSATISVRFVS